MSAAYLVLCTVPDEAEGVRIARAVLEERLVACVNIVPAVRSLFRWQGAIEDATEWLLLMKTAKERYDALEQRVRALHPYEVCEVIALDVCAGSQPYLAWLTAETRHTAEP